MSIDIEAIRKKLEQINSGGKSSGNSTKFKRWKYDRPGEFKLRILPFKNTDPGNPYPERTVYYNISGENRGMLVSPENVGERDPIKEFRIKLFSDAKNAATESEAAQLKEMAKKLQAKTAYCVAVIDRANEAAGVQLWSPNFTDMSKLLNLFLTKAGDYTNVHEGRDIVLIVNESKKINMFTKKPMLDANITVDLDKSPAAPDAATLKKWESQMPNIDEYFPVNTTEEMEAKLKEWLDASANGGTDGDGTERGGKEETAPKVDAKPAAAKPVASKASPAKKPILQQVDDDLDAELADLGND